ncbi:MAG: porin family protein, partial [candidate division WOR-3 bacterium]|nr:porin family protein [candidate division WOR-3 bacterium]
MKKALIIMALLIPCLMMAQISLGVRAGIAKIKNVDDLVFTFGGLVGYNVMPKLLAGLEVDYWTKSESQTILGVTVSGRTADAAFTAVGKYAVIEAPVKVCVGAGLGVHMMASTATAGSISTSASETNFAAHGILEAGYPINPNLSIMAQAKYAQIFSDPSS